jgi:RNA polymerase sigma factor (sigma-70 family)
MEATISKDQIFNEVYNNYQSLIISIIRNKIRNPQDIEDISIEVFQRIYEKQNMYNSDKGKLSTWVTEITNNIIVDFFRNKNIKRDNQTIKVSDYVNENNEEMYEIIDNNSNIDYVIEQSELKKNLHKAIRSLKPVYRKIAIMFFFNNIKMHEIANIYNVPINSIKVYIMRIKEELSKNPIIKREYQLL